MFKEYKDLSDGNLYELSLFIDNLYTLNVYEEDDYLWIKNRIRHIMEILLTNEVYDGIIKVDKESSEESN